MAVTQCPPEDALGRYAIGQTSEAEAQTLENHFDSCTQCLSRLDALASVPDQLMSALRRPYVGSQGTNPALAEAVAAVLGGQTIDTPASLPGAPPGTVLSGYRILEELGHGGMGRVYRAMHPRLEQEVALKLLRTGLDSGNFLARFETERQTLALMDHPHIARVSDGGVTEDGQPFLVMELVRGQSVTRYCDEHRLDVRQRLELFILICEAVQHAHQKGIIHRDLKPSNILIADYDGRPTPKVIDFGVAKVVGQRSAGQTEVGMLVGTPEYMSPEQAGLGSLDMDTRSDIYALGVLLYELLTGDTPLARQKAHTLPVLEVLRLIREADAPPPMRGELDWIVLKALEKDRARRYETTAALADDVRRFLNDELVLAGPPSKAYRMRKFVRRHRRALATAAAFALLLVAGVVISAWLAVEAREAQAQAEIDRDKAVAAGKQAKDSAAEAQSVLQFFQERMLAVGRPEGQDGGLGREVTIRKAVDAAEPRIAEAFQGQPLVEASVRNTLGITYIYVGDPVAAAKQLERSWELRREGLGPDHTDTLVSLHDLGVACRQAGELERALALLEQAWKKRAALLGEKHLSTLRSMRELAAANHDASKLDQATDLAARALAGFTTELGPDHVDTLLAKANLALAHQAAGRFKPAVALFEEAVEGLTNQVGVEHPYTLATMNMLGLAYRAAGKLDLAIPLFNKAIDIQKNRLGPDHLHTLHTMNNLALTFSDQKQSDKALHLLLQVLEARKAKLSADHPSVLMCMNNLASTYQMLGESSKALQMLEGIFHTSKAKLGPDHSDTLQAMNNLAALNFFTGKVDRAIEIHEETLKRRKAKLGVEHLDTLISMNNLAYCYWKAKRIDLAIPLFLQTIQGRSAALGPDHPATLAVVITLSGVYRDVGQLDRALELLGQALDDRRTRLGSDHKDTLRVALELSSAQIDAGGKLMKEKKYAEAEAILRLGLATRTKQLPDTWITFATRSLLGSALTEQKKYAEAEPMLIDGYEGMKQREAKIPEKSKARLTEAVERLVQLYEAWGRPAEAAKWRKLLPSKSNPSV